MLRIAIVAALLLASPAAAALPPVAPQAASSGVIAKDSSGALVGLNVTSGASAGFVMVFDAATIPVDGTVVGTVTSRLIKCMPLAAASGLDLNWRADPVTVGVGAVVVFSIGASCFTVTKSATAFISTEVR